MNIFGIYLSHNGIKIYSKMHQIMYHLKKISSGGMPQNTPSSATRHFAARNSPKLKKKLPPPLANPAYADG